MSFRQVRQSGTGDFSTFPWAPSEHASGLNFTPSLTTGDCMMYLVAASDKIASHYITNIDTAGVNPGFALRYWQPTDSWFAYCNNAASTGNVSASAVGTSASAKVILGARVSGTALSISVNGAITTGGVATPFTASRGVINRDNLTNLVGVYDIYTFPLYLESLAKRIEGFLAEKHGITLAAGHPYRSVAPTQAWNVSDDDGLKIWYDFADSSTVTITGAGISSLVNKADPATYNLTQGTDTDRPSWNGSRATARWSSGSSVGLNITASIPWTNAAYTAVMVADPDDQNTTPAPRLFAARTGTSVNHSIYNGTATLNYRASTTTAGALPILTGYTQGTTRLITLQHDGATNKKAWISGDLVLDDTSANNGPKLCDNFQVLSADGDNVLMNFLVTSTTTDANRQRHEGAIAHEKGLTALLSPSHPYKTRRPIYKEWAPTDDPGLLIWYDFADSSTITITGAGISQITNKLAGGTYTLTQGTDSMRPTWNGLEATGRGGNSSATGLEFIGTVGWTNAAYTLLSTVKYANATTSFPREYVVTDNPATINYHTRLLANAVNNMSVRANSVSGAAGETTIEAGYTADAVPVIRVVEFNGSASGAVSTWRNGTAGAGISGANVNPVTGGAMRLLQGSSAIITIGDFIVSSSATTAIRQKHEGYLAWKRGTVTTLDASHPYKARPPLTTD